MIALLFVGVSVGLAGLLVGDRLRQRRARRDRDVVRRLHTYMAQIPPPR